MDPAADGVLRPVSAGAPLAAPAANAAISSEVAETTPEQQESP